MTEMSIKEIRRFLKQGTFTGKLATVKEDGSPHVVPIWFVLGDDGISKAEDRGNYTYYWKHFCQS